MKDTKKTWVALTRSVLALVTALFAGLAFVSCSAGGNVSSKDTAHQSASESGWPRTVQTDDGELTLEAQPQRIVSTSTTLTGSLLAVGAPVVASAATVPGIPELSDDKGFFSQWSEAAQAAGLEKLYENSSPNLEKVAEYSPDLIVVSKNSGDSVMDSVEQLRKLAPVLVIDYSGKSWQEVTRMVGEATGHETQAQERIEAFDSRLERLKSKITVPEGTTSAFIVFGDGSGAAALTEQAPQVQILTALGFTMATIPDSVKGDTSMGADRQDIINLSLENIQAGLPGNNWIAVSADAAAKEQIKNDRAFNSSEAVKNGKVFTTPGETFRLDYYSANIMLDSLEESFGK